jgi:hypothetical protein
LRNLGIQQATQFSWEKAARRHIELYSGLLCLN